MHLQVGCIYTAQGLEFDHTGVIWWNDLRWDEQALEWKLDLDSCCDIQFIRSIAEQYCGKLIGSQPPWSVQHRGKQKSMPAFLRDSGADLTAVKELVLNTYRVLLTRAKRGVHIWFQDKVTEAHVRKVMGIKQGPGRHGEA
jgi:DUF2075 family protein